MIVRVLVKRVGFDRTGPEKAAILDVPCHLLWGACAADVVVQANHPIRRRHDHVQVVAD